MTPRELKYNSNGNVPLSRFMWQVNHDTLSSIESEGWVKTGILVKFKLPNAILLHQLQKLIFILYGIAYSSIY